MKILLDEEIEMEAAKKKSASGRQIVAQNTCVINTRNSQTIKFGL